ncbi:hypothetical protein BDQ17DRAFT_1490892 [Cyathus striatus]|nr:hypothetical protein BDQ17DRAFT_1490892 [Cyathus striatus]
MSTNETETEVIPSYKDIVPIAAPKPIKKLKPARKQVKPGDVVKTETVQTGKEYNIWYNKWAGGDREDSYSNKTKSQTRCNIRRDSGLTRANMTGMKYCCIFFARGCCPYGWECEYLHTLPDVSMTLPDTSKDCFARDKFADYRDDMGGVGSFNRQNRTLYVGRIKETGTGPETEEVVTRHFKEWGAIEKIRVLQYRSVAFVTYVHEYHAQFAKEAMACQSLDNDEILNVRWATEDPNPQQKSPKSGAWRKLDGDALQEGEVMDEEEDGDEPGAKRRRLEIENGDDSGGEEEPPSPQQQQSQPQGPPKPASLLSTDMLESLKYFAEIRKQNGGTPIQQQPRAAPKAAALVLGDYGSDDED